MQVEAIAADSTVSHGHAVDDFVGPARGWHRFGTGRYEPSTQRPKTEKRTLLERSCLRHASNPHSHTKVTRTTKAKATKITKKALPQSQQRRAAGGASRRRCETPYTRVPFLHVRHSRVRRFAPSPLGLRPARGARCLGVDHPYQRGGTPEELREDQCVPFCSRLRIAEQETLKFG
jgi:hypothetical protein